MTGITHPGPLHGTEQKLKDSKTKKTVCHRKYSKKYTPQININLHYNFKITETKMHICGKYNINNDTHSCGIN